MRRIAGLGRGRGASTTPISSTSSACLHDGQRPYPGAVETLARLKESGARIALVSNSGKRAAPNVARLTGLGFPETSYDAFVTSGEVAWTMIAGGELAVPKANGEQAGRCLVLSRAAGPFTRSKGSILSRQRTQAPATLC